MCALPQWLPGSIHSAAVFCLIAIASHPSKTGVSWVAVPGPSGSNLTMMLLLLALYNQFIVWLPVCPPAIFLCGFLNVFIISIWNQSFGPDASYVQPRLSKWRLTQWAKQLALCCHSRKCLITAEYTHHHWWQHICIKVPLFWGDSYHLSKLLLFSLSPQSFYWVSEQFQAISLQIQALFNRTALLENGCLPSCVWHQSVMSGILDPMGMAHPVLIDASFR